jgi:predicted dehydrogenase
MSDRSHGVRGGRRLRVGVVGCGLIAQLVHLPGLLRLSDQIEVAALCDRAPDVLEQVGARYGVMRRWSSMSELLKEPLDAVAILTSGPHEQMVLQALQAGLHVFVEKPFCFDPAQGARAVRAAAKRGLTVMVGCQKRYDPAFDAAADALAGGGDLSLVRTASLEGPLAASLASHDIIGGAQKAPPPGVKRPEVDAVLPGASQAVRAAYQNCLLESMVHDVNLVRGLVHGPVEVQAAAVCSDGAGVSAQLRIGRRTQWVAVWHSFSGLDRYRQEFSFHSERQWLELSYSSPFQLDCPTTLTIERPGPAAEATSEERVTASFQSSHLLQLQDFHRCVVDGARPRTGAAEGLADVRVLQEIARKAMFAEADGRSALSNHRKATHESRLVN